MFGAATWVDELRVQALAYYAAAPKLSAAKNIVNTLAFLDVLPATVARPVLKLGEGDEIALLWEGDNRAFVVVPETGHVRFVAAFGSEERRGREAFSVGVPRVVREILTQAFPRMDA